MGLIYYTLVHTYNLMLEVFSALTALAVGYLIFGLMREWFYIIQANVSFELRSPFKLLSREMDAV